MKLCSEVGHRYGGFKRVGDEWVRACRRRSCVVEQTLSMEEVLVGVRAGKLSIYLPLKTKPKKGAI